MPSSANWQGVGFWEQVVITGSSRGLGYALADSFLALGDDVVVSSRSAEACAAAAERLAAAHPQRRVRHLASDVRDAGGASPLERHKEA